MSGEVNNGKLTSVLIRTAASLVADGQGPVDRLPRRDLNLGEETRVDEVGEQEGQDQNHRREDDEPGVGQPVGHRKEGHLREAGLLLKPRHCYTGIRYFSLKTLLIDFSYGGCNCNGFSSS